MSTGRAQTIIVCTVTILVLAASVAAIIIFKETPSEPAAIRDPAGHEHAGSEAEEERNGAPRAIPIDRFGIADWRQSVPSADADGEEVRARFLDKRAAREAESLSDRRPELTYSAPAGGHADDEGAALVGLIDPVDEEAIKLLIAMNELIASGHTSAPPRSQVDSIGRVISAVLPLLSAEGGADVASDAADLIPLIERRLGERGVRIPDRFRIWRLLATPADSGYFGTSSSFDIKHDAAILEVASAIRKRSFLSIDPIDGGVLTGRIAMSYQTEDRTDRALTFRFIYDRETESWILYEIIMAPSYADQRRYYDTENYEALFGGTYTINFLDILPDCVIVTGEGLRCDRR